MHLDLIGQDGVDLLSGGTENCPAVFGGIWERHGLSKAPQQRLAHGQAVRILLVLEMLQAQLVHINLEFVFSNMFHPRAQTLKQVRSSRVLRTNGMVGRQVRELLQ